MVRAPCCESTGLKKGPWSSEEDQILVSYIRRFGHDNWRALPKRAGLLRCGKSCRLRWMNYLRPDIKRGNFTREEEDAIIRLHGLLGNKWSAIAAEIPGRTDNEIKNVWHTHLKKRAQPSRTDLEERSCSDLSSCSTLTGGESTAEDQAQLLPELLWMDEEEWWSEALSLDNSTSVLGFSEASSSIPLDGRADASSEEDDEDFWMRMLMASEAMPELPNF